MNGIASPASAGSTDIHAHIAVERPCEGSAAFINVEAFRHYAAGTQTLVLTLEQQDILKGILNHKFCDNVCHQIIAEAADRLELLRFDCEDTKTHDYLSDWFSTATLSDFAGTVHYNALRDGNHVVALGWDDARQMVMLYQEDWWNGYEGVWIAYDNNDNMLYAVKEWRTPDGIRRNIWFEDRVERYMGAGAANSQNAKFQPYHDVEDGMGWSVAWTQLDGTPLHIPYVHFANPSRGKRNYGTSEIDGGVLGFQDQLNDLQYDMSAAGRMTGFQMLGISGVKKEIDPVTKKEIPMKVGPGQVFTSSNPQTRYQVLEAGDISQLLHLYLQKLKSVSRMTRTPLHLITGGEWPSGEALLRAELPAVGKAMRQAKRFAPAWVSVAHKATEIANVFGRAGLDESAKSAKINAVYSPVERRDQLSKSVVVANLGDRISDREALRVMGTYSDEQIEKIMEEKKQEVKDFAPAVLATNPQGNPTPTPQVKPQSNIGRTDRQAV